LFTGVVSEQLERTITTIVNNNKNRCFVFILYEFRVNIVLSLRHLLSCSASKMSKLNDKVYYVAHNLLNHDIIICTSKTMLSKFVGCSDDTIRRKLLSEPVRIKECIVWTGIGIQRIKNRGNF
jgi:hypothetical protein